MSGGGKGETAIAGMAVHAIVATARLEKILRNGIRHFPLKKPVACMAD
ncbi:hypothetical protein [Sorlinia euscelidii]